MALDVERLARWATLLLTAIAYAACETASHSDGVPTWFGLGFGLAMFALAILGTYLFPFPRSQQKKPPLRISLVLVASLFMPIAIEPLLREITDNGQPLEMQLVNGLRVLGMGLAAASAWAVYRRLAGVVTLFLALFTCAMGDQPAIPYLLVALAMVGAVWLVLCYRAERTDTITALPLRDQVGRVALRFPTRELLVFGALAAIAFAALFVGPKQTMGTLGELVPTSGGTGEQDPFARYGTNDGPEEIAGDDANSVGMIESNLFIESNKDSLLDVVGDMYGPPHKPKQDEERLVAAGQERVKENHKKLTENKRPSRDFDTARKGPKVARKAESRGPRGLFEVEGRTPLHIAAVTYDRYDVEKKRWLQAPSLKSRFIDADPGGGDWMLPTNRRTSGDWYAAQDQHQLKVADLKDRLVPTPAMTARFKIRKVTLPDYYEWDYDGVLGLAGRTKTPSGVIVHTECRTLDPTALPEDAFAISSFPLVYLDIPTELQNEFRRVAQSWTAGVSSGWPQVEAICRNLRSNYMLDRSSVAPENHASPVLWFLNESKQGPDYLFATTAALLLRSLGYPTRVCLGYYADPTAYDPVSQHTPVKSTDLHVWPEVLLRDGHWLVVEPTPGYLVLPPRRSFADRTLAAINDLGGWALRHLLELIIAVLLIAMLVWHRRQCVDLLLTALWKIGPGRSWRHSTLNATRLLERRCRLAGCPRSEFETLYSWASRINGVSTDDRSLRELVQIAEWAAYAPHLPPPIPEGEVRVACRRAIEVWTRRRIRFAWHSEGAA